MSTGQYVGVTYNGGWQIGAKSTDGDKINFTPYDKLIKVTSSGQMILSRDTTSYWKYWGGVYMEGDPYAFFSGGTYNADYTEATLIHDPTVRYTAERAGTIEISVNELFFYTDNSTSFAIYHNGKAVSVPVKSSGGK